jgi:hypothetical protein
VATPPARAEKVALTPSVGHPQPNPTAPNPKASPATTTTYTVTVTETVTGLSATDNVTIIVRATGWSVAHIVDVDDIIFGIDQGGDQQGFAKASRTGKKIKSLRDMRHFIYVMGLVYVNKIAGDHLGKILHRNRQEFFHGDISPFNGSS